MSNNLEKSKIFQTALDQLAIQQSVTGWMDANSGQTIYNGGDEIKIPTISTDGLANYDREAGYVGGAVSLKYETYKMTQDRGRVFKLDAMDVNETNFVATASAVMGNFQTYQVTPEIDAYRLSKLASVALKDENKAKFAKFGYTPAKDTILKEIKTGISKIRDNGYAGELVIHITNEAKMELDLSLVGNLSNTTFSVGGVDTQVPAIDKVPLIETPQNRMYTVLKINDGKTTGQEKGGYVKADNAKTINFIIVAKTAPIAVSKQDLVRIFDPNTNQEANAWKIDYRRFHDLWVLKQQEQLVYVNIKDGE